MDNFKKDLFLKEYNIEPQVENLTAEDLMILHHFFKQKKIPLNRIFEELFKKLPNKASFNNLDTSIEIRNALVSLNMTNDENVFVIWDYPNNIDKFRTEYLLDYWEDFWFSVSDEAMGLFFPNEKKIFLITHYNTIYY
jgi:hypothetical protein